MMAQRQMKPEPMSVRSSTVSLPWEAIYLVSHYLDHRTLAIASCVCKSWSISMSSDHIGKPICSSHYPSLSNLRNTDSAATYHRLFAIGYTSIKRRCQNPPKPHLSLNDVVFTVALTSGNSHIATVIKPGVELQTDPIGLFRFEVDVDQEPLISKGETIENMKISWNVVLKGWKGVFTMIDSDVKVEFVPGAERWFSEELPSPGCCSGGVGSGMAADLKVRFGSGERMSFDKVSMAILSVINWRYLSVDDGLRYLQHFLLPCNI